MKKVTVTKKVVSQKPIMKATMTKKQTAAPKDSIATFKSKAGMFAKKDFARKDFMKKTSSLQDSANKYDTKVFNAASKMNKSDLAKNKISKAITNKADTVYKFNSGGISFKKVNPKKK
jgi:hypothetical protein